MKNLDTFIDADEFISELNADASDINKSMAQVTSKLAWYGIQMAKARKQRDDTKQLVEIKTVALNKTFRERLEAVALKEADGGKPARVTEAMVACETMLNRDLIHMTRQLHEAEEIYQICMVARDAMKQRGDMLRSIGALTRDQLQTDVQIRSAEDSADRFKNRRAKFGQQRKTNEG